VGQEHGWLQLQAVDVHSFEDSAVCKFVFELLYQHCAFSAICSKRARIRCRRFEQCHHMVTLELSVLWLFHSHAAPMCNNRAMHIGRGCVFLRLRRPGAGC